MKRIENYEKIKKLLNQYLQHGQTSVLVHSRNVAYLSYVFARRTEKITGIKFDYEALVIGAFLHDLFLYDWHVKSDRQGLHGLTHPITACENAKKMCNINQAEEKIIKTHMWPLTITRVPKSREAAIVCMMDKYSAVVETIKGGVI